MEEKSNEYDEGTTGSFLEKPQNQYMSITCYLKICVIYIFYNDNNSFTHYMKSNIVKTHFLMFFFLSFFLFLISILDLIYSPKMVTINIYSAICFT